MPWLAVSLLVMILMIATLASCQIGGVTVPPVSVEDETSADITAGSGETEIITLPSFDSETDPDTEANTESSTDTHPATDDATETAEPETQPVLEPGESSTYNGVLIHSVYGTGKKGAEALISNGYVQLYNKSSRDISLAGAALYYNSDEDTPFEQFVFPVDAIIPAGGYYLVRTLSPNGFDPSNAVMRIENCDAEWPIYLDNKEVRLLLAPMGLNLPRDADVTAYGDAVSCFVATMEYHTSVYALYDLSRNKIAVRTAMEEYSGYHTVNLTRAATPDLEALCTRTSDGEVNEVVVSRINEVLFSSNAGIYEKAFILRLTAKAGYTIYYTTDGSDPTKASNPSRIAYSSGIMLTNTSVRRKGKLTRLAENYALGSPSVSSQIGGHVIKAYATNGTDSTAVFTNTYFITDDLAQYGVSVMSISMPAEEVIGRNGFYNNYLVIPDSLTSGRNRGVGIMEVFDPSGERVGNSRVELAVSGNGSSGWSMKSLRIYIKGSNNQDAGLQSDLNYDIFGGEAKDTWGQAITSFSRLMLRNGGNDCGMTYIRDAFMQSTAAGLNVDYMESASTLVFINGEFWGVYNLRERYSPEYVESHYGVDKDNVAIIENNYEQLVTNGNISADYVLSAGEEGDEIPFNEMVEYMRTHDLSVQSNYEYVASLMDMDSFIDMWVVRLYYVAIDWPQNNVKVWRNKNPDDPSGFDTKWHFVLLDLDMGLTFYDSTSEYDSLMGAIGDGSVCGTMMGALLRNAGFKQQFIERYYSVVMNHLTPERLNVLFDELYEERDPLVALQVGRWSNSSYEHMRGDFSESKWWEECELIRSFINNRSHYAVEQLLDYFRVSEKGLTQLVDQTVIVNLRSDRVAVFVDGERMQNGDMISLSGKSKTLSIVATPKEGYVITSITFVDESGSIQTIAGGSGTIRARRAGVIRVETSPVS